MRSHTEQTLMIILQCVISSVHTIPKQAENKQPSPPFFSNTLCILMEMRERLSRSGEATPYSSQSAMLTHPKPVYRA